MHSFLFCDIWMAKTILHTRIRFFKKKPFNFFLALLPVPFETNVCSCPITGIKRGNAEKNFAKSFLIHLNRWNVDIFYVYYIICNHLLAHRQYRVVQWTFICGISGFPNNNAIFFSYVRSGKESTLLEFISHKWFNNCRMTGNWKKKFLAEWRTFF